MPSDSCQLWVYKWEKPVNSELAVAKTRAFIKQKHSTTKRVIFTKMQDDKGAWTLWGAVEFKRAYLFTTARNFRVKVNMDTGVIASYEEMPLRNTKNKSTLTAGCYLDK